MSAFGKSHSKRVARPRSAGAQVDIERTCAEIVDKKIIDVYRFINELNKKKKKEFLRPPDLEVVSNIIPEPEPEPEIEITAMPKALSRGSLQRVNRQPLRCCRESPFVESVEVEEPIIKDTGALGDRDLIKDVPIIIKKRPARKMHPLILPDGFARKSIHEPTESSENKTQPKPKLILMDRVQKVGS